MRRLLPPLLLILLLLALLIALLLWQGPSRTSHLSPPPQGGDFLLQGPQGPVALSNFRGQVVVLYFGYTWCPDICPTSLAVLAAAINALDAEQQQQVHGLLVSVDPERDDLPRLLEYTAYFHPRILGLVGEEELLHSIAGQYGAAFQRVAGESENYPVDHSADLYLIDRQGRLRETLPHGTLPQQLLDSLQRLLAEPPGAA